MTFVSVKMRDVEKHNAPFASQEGGTPPAYWGGIFAMTLRVFALIASEFMPVSLLFDHGGYSPSTGIDPAAAVDRIHSMVRP